MTQLQDTIQTTSANRNSAVFDYDPTQMQDLINKLDELIHALRRA